MVLGCAPDAIEWLTHALRLGPLDPRMIGVLTGTASGPTSAPTHRSIAPSSFPVMALMRSRAYS